MRNKGGEDASDDGRTPADANEGSGEAEAPESDRPEDLGPVGVLGEVHRRMIGHGVLGILLLTSLKV